MKTKHKLFCILGRTGSGKTFLANAVAKSHHLHVVKSYTTRPPRDGENNANSDHIFITDEQFSDIPQKAIVAYTEINGYKYFCTLNQLLTSDIYVIDPLGLQYLQKRLPELTNDIELVSFYIKCDSTNERAYRFISRDKNSTVENFERRNRSEDEQFTDFELHGECNYIVDNSDNDDSALAMMNLYIIKERIF